MTKEEKQKKQKKANQDKRYRQANKEKLAVKRKRYYKANKKVILAKQKIWRETNKKLKAIRDKIYYETNKKKIRIKQKKYYQENKVAIQKQQATKKEDRRLYMTRWRILNKDKIEQYNLEHRELRAKQKKVYRRKRRKEDQARQNKRRKTDIQYRLRCQLRTRLNNALCGKYKAGSAVRDLGCSIEELKVYLESKFKPGMTWKNWSPTGWHIDHIKALSKFNLTDRKQLLEAFNYRNLQPLWASENHRKGNK